jgi:hypothetical protein
MAWQLAQVGLGHRIRLKGYLFFFLHLRSMRLPVWPPAEPMKLVPFNIMKLRSVRVPGQCYKDGGVAFTQLAYFADFAFEQAASDHHLIPDLKGSTTGKPHPNTPCPDYEEQRYSSTHKCPNDNSRQNRRSVIKEQHTGRKTDDQGPNQKGNSPTSTCPPSSSVRWCYMLHTSSIHLKKYGPGVASLFQWGCQKCSQRFQPQLQAAMLLLESIHTGQ